MFLTTLIFLPAFVSAGVCELPIATCSPAPCDYRTTNPTTLKVPLVAIPMTISPPDDACDTTPLIVDRIPFAAPTSGAGWINSLSTITELPLTTSVNYKRWIASTDLGPRIDGTCGPLPPVATAPAPSCASGTPGAISGAGPWNWTCSGSGPSHTDDFCTVMVATLAVDGICGAAVNGGTFATMPSSGLCDSGTASAVTGTGTPWSWTCDPSGGSTVIGSCSATQSVIPFGEPGLVFTMYCEDTKIWNAGAQTMTYNRSISGRTFSAPTLFQTQVIIHYDWNPSPGVWVESGPRVTTTTLVPMAAFLCP